MTRTVNRVIVAMAVVCATAVVSQAQQSATSTETKAFEVLAVEGNQLVVRLPEGTRELTVPDDFRFTVDGKSLSVRELKAGMKGTAIVTTRTVVKPVTVTEVRNGTVMQSTGTSIVVRTEDGVRMFSQGDVDRRAMQIMRNGQPAQVSDFRRGDRLTATIITSKPPQVMTEKEVNATLAAGGAAAAGAGPAAGVAASSASSASASGAPASEASASGAQSGAPAGQDSAAGGTRRMLPKTASLWPSVGLASLLSLTLGAALTVRRRFVR